MSTQFMSRMVVFDDGLGQLGPMTDLRAAFEVRTGMYTTAVRLRNHRPKTLAAYWVPEPLKAIVSARSDAPVNVAPDDEILYCVNGRWAIPDPALDLGLGEAVVEDATGHVVAARLRHADAGYFLSTGQLHERAQVTRLHRRVLYKYPWDVIGLLKDAIIHDIMSLRMPAARIPGDVATVVGGHPVEVHASATVGPHVVLDAERGPIVVHERSVIRPGAIVCGPCSIGPEATVVDRAHIKPHTVIGPGCKVGGEVGATIFQGWANKSHEGHLGDSWVGKWVNLGAGTTNSNLLNTYGEVTMRIEADGPRHRTGLTFLGAVIGDHVKTAIGTRIMTGTVLGTGAMIASTLPPPATVRRFAWLTDDGERTYRFEKFVEAMEAMMARRDRKPNEAYLARLRELHAAATARRPAPPGPGATALPEGESRA